MNLLAKVLLVLLLIVFPTGELLRFKISQNIYATPQDILSFLLFILICIQVIRQKIKPQQREFVLLSLLFIAFGILSLGINRAFNPSYNFFVSILYPFRYLVYISIFFLPNLVASKKLINNLLFISGGLIVTGGILQYFFYNNLGNLYYLGWDDHLYRLFSTFLDPNFVGLFYVIYLGFIANRINNLKKVSEKLPELLIGILSTVSIFLTFSRTGFLALLIFVLTLFLTQKKYKELVLVSFTLVILLFVFSDRSIEGLNPFRTFSTNERIKSSQNAFRVFIDHPLVGVGFNAYRYTQIDYGFRNEVGSANSNADAGTDNSYLFVLATTGIVGLIIIAYAYYNLLKNLMKNNKYYFSAAISLLFGSLFINALFYIPILTFTFLMITFMDSKSRAGR